MTIRNLHLSTIFLTLAVFCNLQADKYGPRWNPRVSANHSPNLRKEIDWSNEIIYFVLIDRFFNGDSSNDRGNNPAGSLRYDPFSGNITALKTFQGGDLAGVLQKLDYIASLGFTVVWLSPVFDNEDRDFAGWWPYHGYSPVDFFAVDEHFGDLELIRQVVREAHARSMKVILDMIYNHASPAHPWVVEKEFWDGRGYRYWFHPHSGTDASTSISDWQDQHQLENFELNGLPDWAQENPHVYEFMLDYSKFWILETDCDGFRLDAVKHVPRAFWQQLCRDLHAFAGPGFLLLGEVFSGDVDYVASYQSLGFNSLFDIPLYYTVQRVFAQGAPVTLLSDQLAEEEKFRDVLLSRLLDNHDVARFSYQAGERVEEKILSALTFLWSLNGPPILYYGTEAALPGAAPQNELTGEGQDFLNRLPMPWQQLKMDSPLIRGIRRLNERRRGSPALRRGNLYEIYKDYGVYCFLKYTDNDARLVVLNNSTFDEERRFFLDPNVFPPNLELEDELRGGVLTARADTLHLQLAGLSGTWLKPMGQLYLDELRGKNRRCAFTPRLTRDYQLVRFILPHDSTMQSVYLAGDFNGWSPVNHPLQHKNGRWEIDLPLKAGRYRYKFVVNGKEWIADPAAAEYELDPYGGRNSVKLVQ